MLTEEFTKFMRDRRPSKAQLVAWLVTAINSGKYRYVELFKLLDKKVAVSGCEAGSKLFADPQRLIDVIKQIRDPQYLTLLCSFIDVESNQIKSVVGDLLTRHHPFDFGREFTELKGSKLTADKRAALREDLTFRLFDMARVCEVYGVDVDVNLQLRWLCMVQGSQQMEMRMVGIVLKHAFKKQNKIRPDEVWQLLRSQLPGSSNIALLISQLRDTKQLVKNFAYELNKLERQASVFNLLLRDCMPPNTLTFVKNVIGEMHNSDSRVMHSLMTQFALPTLYHNLSTSMYFQQIEGVISAILGKCKQFTLNSDELKQLEALPFNMQYEKKHRELLANIISKCEGYGQPKAISEINTKKSTINAPASNSTLFYNPQSHPVAHKLSQHSSDSVPSPMTHLPHRGSSNDSRKEQIIFESEDYVGLPNIGNTCYINSFLINLYFCREFRKYIVKQRPSSKTLDCMIRIFNDLDIKNTVGLKDLVHEFKDSLPQNFSGNQSQHDCMEFGRELIDMMMTDASLTKEIRSFFESRFQEVIVCPYNHDSSKREVTETHIILSFGGASRLPGPVSINDLVEKNFRRVQIKTDFKCEKCMRSSATCQKEIINPEFPKVWVVVLSRFTYDKQKQNYGKITDRVVAGDYLLLSNLHVTTRNVKYKLNSFINHMGSTPLSGHYQSYVRHPTEDDRWLVFDDHYVMEMQCKSTDELFRSFSEADTPYILVYEMIS